MLGRLQLAVAAALLVGALCKPYMTQELVDRINRDPTLHWRAKLYPRFAGMSVEELQAMANGAPGMFTRNLGSRASGSGRSAYVPPYPTDDLPENYNPVEEHPECVQPPMDQGACGNCYCVSAIESFSDLRCLHGLDKERVLYSSVYSTSCDDSNGGCNGGMVYKVWSFLTTHGAVPNSCLPYDTMHADMGYCPSVCEDGSPVPKLVHAKGWHNIGLSQEGNSYETIMASLVYNGPAATCFLICPDFNAYESGIYSPLPGQYCGSAHCMEIVGYGVSEEDDDLPYWIIKNTWGPDWGEGGFIRFERGSPLSLLEDDVIEGHVD